MIGKTLPKRISRKFKVILKKFNPKLKHYYKEWKEFSKYDMDRFKIHSNVMYKYNTKNKLISDIVSVYHTIEKGLTIENSRLGFGNKRILHLIQLCKIYQLDFNDDDELFYEAIGVIAEYNRFHKEKGFEIDNNIQENINSFMKDFTHIEYTKQPEYTKKDFLKYQNNSFLTFSGSRHSVRHFTDERIDINLLKKTVELAQNAPSTCNRQSVRVHIVSNKNKINSILNLQNGNRGFGAKADKLIVLTSDLQSWDNISQRYGPYFDAGIYTLNLLYSLHFYGIGACALNWYNSIENDKTIHGIIEVPENEVVTVLIVCGNIPEYFKTAKSKRRKFDSILTIHT
jgi:hypothetical protein